MILRVNKNTATPRPVKYAALASGTVSHVWYDEDSASGLSPKRRNRIRLTREKALLITSADRYDA